MFVGCVIFWPSVGLLAQKGISSHPLRYQGTGPQSLLEDKVERWGQNAVNAVRSSVLLCSWDNAFVNWATDSFCINRIQSQQEALLRWLALLPEEREEKRAGGEDLRTNNSTVIRDREYRDVVDEISRRDALTREEFAQYTVEHELWPHLDITGKAMRWYAEAMEATSQIDDSWIPFRTGLRAREVEIHRNEDALIRWIHMDSYERDLERIGSIVRGEASPNLSFSLYRTEKYLREILRYIDAWDTLTRAPRQRERLEAWSSLTYGERHLWRIGENQGDHLRYRIFPLIESSTSARAHASLEKFLGADFKREVDRIRNEDLGKGYRDTVAAIDEWMSLDRQEREHQRERGEGMKIQLNHSPFFNIFINRLDQLEENDFQARFLEHTSQIDHYMNLSYDERNAFTEDNPQSTLSAYINEGRVPWFLPYQYDLHSQEASRLSGELDNRMRVLTVLDNSTRDGYILHEVTTALSTSSAYDIPNWESSAFLGGYRNLKIKLFPISGDYCRVYPQTRREDLRSLTLGGSGEILRLEVHDHDSSLVYLLEERAQAVEMSVNEPSDLDHYDNFVRYTSSDGTPRHFRLSNLINGEGIRENYHLKIIPQEYLNPVPVKWGRDLRRVEHSFRGSFSIETTHRKDTTVAEWSLINDVPVDWYLRSVTPSELSPTDPILQPNQEALMAQAVAARTYALSKAMDNTLRLRRGWDLDPSTYFQAYLGADREHERSNRAVAATMGIVLTNNGEIVEAEYHACVPRRTRGTSENPVLKARNIPSSITCSSYGEIGGGGHGRGMSQVGLTVLVENGWDLESGIPPSEDARLPDNLETPWSYRDALFYFYDGVELTNFTDL